MRIFGGGIATETNTFASVPTALEDFQVQRGEDVLGGKVPYPNLNLDELWGGMARDRGDVFVFGFMALATPSGRTLRRAYESLRDELLSHLKAAMPVDIVLLMLHGAMVADGYDDCEEDILLHVRRMVGPEAVIGVELDLHCHLSESLIAPADLVITYKEYPHTDIDERARELFRLAVATRRGEIRPEMALSDCRMVGLYPTTRSPLRELIDEMKEAEREPDVLSVSFGHGFQFADVPHVGAKVLVITDNDIARAEALARDFALRAYRLRARIGCESFALPMAQALGRALESKNRPVVVADQADNVGGGAPGDSTFALRWLIEHEATDVALGIYYDPEVVKIAAKAGAGSRLNVRLGGKMGRFSGDPVDLEVEVLSTRRQYAHAFPQQSGRPWIFPAGDVVGLRSAGIDVVVSSERCQCFAPTIFTDLGIDPSRKRVVVVKSVQHFYGAFAPLAGEVIYMAAPGAVAPDPRQIPYRRLDTSALYPWIQDPLGDTGHPQS